MSRKVLKLYTVSECQWDWMIYESVISAREKLAVCDVTNLPYMDINWQSISIYMAILWRHWPPTIRVRILDVILIMRIL